MTKKATKLLYLELQSELEALLTEAELIKTYQPQFNVLLKDDKSPLYIQITHALYPTVKKIRKKSLIFSAEKSTVFGPFSSGSKVTEVLKIARGIFQWCDTPPKHRDQAGSKPCFYFHLEKCSGACIGRIRADEYQSAINNLQQFLSGKTKEVVKQMRADMLACAAEQNFEKAAHLRDGIAAIEFVTSPSFKLKPQLTTPGLANKKSEDGLLYLRRILANHGLVGNEYQLKRIEGYDVSNTSGTQAAVSQVVFIDGQPATDEYRIYYIRDLETPNDYQMMKQAIIRRQNHPEWDTPQLIVVDGGKGQVRAALQGLSWSVPVIGIAKNPDRLIIPNTQRAQDSAQPTHFVERLSEKHPALHVVQNIRDEAHRFSQKHHKKRRLKQLFNA